MDLQILAAKEQEMEMSALHTIVETAPDTSARRVRALTVIERSPARPPASDLKRRLVCTVWRLLPPAAQRLAVRLVAPKVSLGACGVIHDSHGRVLLAHHTYRRQPWSLPGGFVKGDEQPAEALERELREELRVTATAGEILHAETDPSTRHMTLYYRVTIAGAPQCDGVEVDELRFVSPRTIPDLVGAVPHWVMLLDARQAS